MKHGHRLGGHTGDVHLTSARSVWVALYILGAGVLLSLALATVAVVKAYQKNATFNRVTITPPAGQDTPALTVKYAGSHLDHNTDAVGIMVDLPPQGNSTKTSQTGIMVRNGNVGLVASGNVSHGVQVSSLSTGGTAFEGTGVPQDNLVSRNGTGIVF